VELRLHAFLTSALDGGEWSASRPTCRFTPRERAPGTHWIGGWVGYRVGLDTVLMRKFPSPCRDSNSPIIHSVAQCYTTELSQLPTGALCGCLTASLRLLQNRRLKIITFVPFSPRLWTYDGVSKSFRTGCLEREL
jgi:hypothetical protein